MDGPDFSIQVAVPKNATRGRAVVDVGGVAIDVTVGDRNTPPCNWATFDATNAAIRDCPEPWPCEVYLAQGLVKPECPPPCVDYPTTASFAPECPCPQYGVPG